MIYPILSRLKRDGLLDTTLEESPEGPARKYYQLTDRGKGLVESMNGYWDSLAAGVAAVRKEGS